MILKRQKCGFLFWYTIFVKEQEMSSLKLWLTCLSNSPRTSMNPSRSKQCFTCDKYTCFFMTQHLLVGCSCKGSPVLIPAEQGCWAAPLNFCGGSIWVLEAPATATSATNLNNVKKIIYFCKKKFLSEGKYSRTNITMLLKLLRLLKHDKYKISAKCFD